MPLSPIFNSNIITVAKLQKFFTGLKNIFRYKSDDYTVALSESGSITSYSQNLLYADVKNKLRSHATDVYLIITYSYTEDGVQKSSRAYAIAKEQLDEDAGPIQFFGSLVMNNGGVAELVFALDSSNTLSVDITLRENALLKTNDVIGNSSSYRHYPSAKAVYDQFQRKPAVVWDAGDGAGLAAIQANLSAAPNWQLTNLDFSPYKRIKIYSKAGKGSTNAGTTGAMVLEMSLDPRMASAAWGGHYVGSVLSQKPLDNNRYASLTCAVSADKTSFVVLWQSSLYGTAVTANNDIGANVIRIEGYYD